jgi:LacI family transcriptional regulator
MLSPTTRSKSVLAYLTWLAPELWHGLQAYARDAGWILMGSGIARRVPRTPRRFDGVISLISECDRFDQRRLFPTAKIVDIRGLDGFEPDGLVITDHEKAGRMAANYLHELGCQTFVGLDLRRHWRGPRERITAFVRQARELGVEEAYLLVMYEDWRLEYTMTHPQALRKRLERMLGKLRFPVGMFIPEDHPANLVLQETLDLGYRVPDDVAILSCNNDRGICETARVSISSVDMNLSQVGYEAARLLDRLMRSDKSAPNCIVIPPSGIEKRHSTERTSCADPVVASIRGYILDHYMERITAEHIVQAIHVSRSRAFARFRKAMGHSIGDEIERVRMERARSLLETTDYKIDAVARLSGYQSTPTFCRVFKQRSGQTPSEARQGRQ